MIVYTRKSSYSINKEDLTKIELGSLVFDPERKKIY